MWIIIWFYSSIYLSSKYALDRFPDFWVYYNIICLSQSCLSIYLNLFHKINGTVWYDIIEWKIIFQIRQALSNLILLYTHDDVPNQYISAKLSSTVHNNHVMLSFLFFKYVVQKWTDQSSELRRIHLFYGLKRNAERSSNL